MLTLTRLLLLGLVLAAGSSALANNSPFFNANNPYDVDNNNLVTQRDFLLIVNQLQAGNVQPLSSVVDNTTTFYWDTNNNGVISTYDGLLVATHLMATNPVPEPSSVLMAGAGLTALAGYCLRRRWKRA
jgi:hypothetical protein